MIACPSCGGNVKFDIASQLLSCEYCNSFYDPYAFDSKEKDAIEEKDFEATIYTCPQCGGEILSTDNASAGFCSFCGASTILYSRISKEKRPNYIIPFKKTKEDCKKAYEERLKKALFAPKELKDPAHIDSFRGIYMPYWAYHITQNGPLQLDGEKSHRSGDYIITDHYRLTGDIDAFYKGISYDASSSFSDDISESLAPYNVTDIKEFTPAYFSGFYADIADVHPAVYQDDVDIMTTEGSLTQLRKNSIFSGYTLKTPATLASCTSTFHNKTESIDYTMYPVWFMSYKNGDRVSYAAVNGQTGKVVADIPIDKTKYTLGSLLLAIPIYLVLCMFFAPGPIQMLTIAGALALICSIIYTVEFARIVRKENDSDDRGKLSKTNPDELQKNRLSMLSKKKINGKTSNTGTIVVSIFIAFFMLQAITIFGGIITNSSSTAANTLPWVIIIVGVAISNIIGIINISKTEHKRGIRSIILSFISIFVSGIFVLLKSFLIYDYFFYAAAFFTAFTVFFSISDIIRAYNILSSRKLPQFDKKGGDDRA